MFLLGCGVLLTLVGTPIVLVVTWRRARRLERELKELSAEVRRLRADVRTELPTEPEQRRAPAEPRRVETHAVEAHPAAHVPAPAASFPESESVPHTAFPPPASLPTAPRPSSPRGVIDWERWIGVRGAAVVGGIFLALAAIFFFKHAFTQGWISPEARVLAGIAGGAAAIFAAAHLCRRGFGWATSALEGAGVVALYASVWAADERYALISMLVSFPAMALITAFAGALALRHGSLFSALLGLAGGFLTPLLLADGPERTLPLFGYLLLLDVGLLLVARRRGWPSLALCALLATFVFEALSIFGGGERPLLGLSIAASFALLFALSGARGRALADAGTARARWLPTQVLGVLLPLAFAWHYAGEIRFGPHVWPTAAFLGLLVVAAALVARQQGVPWLAAAAALASVAVVAPWVRGLRPGGAAGAAWELALVALGLALVSHALAEWERARPGQRDTGRRSDGWRSGAAASACAWALLVLFAALTRRLTDFPALALGTGALALLLLRQAWLLGLARLAWSAGLALGLALGIAHGGYSIVPGHVEASLPDPRLFWCLPVALALGLLALARLARGFERAAPQAAGALLVACAGVAVFTDAAEYGFAHPWLPALALPFGGVLLWVAARLASSPWVAACVATTVVLAAWGWDQSSGVRPEAAQLLALASGPAFVLVAAGFARELEPRRWTWAFLAVLAVQSMGVLELAWQDVLARRSEGLASLVAGLSPAIAAALLRARRAPNHALGWMAGAAALAFTSALADRIDHAEFALSCALFAAALAWIGRRLALRGAAWTAVASALLATLVLVGMALTPWTYARSERRLMNWIGYAHLVPAAGLGAVVWLLPRANAGPWLARARAVLGGCVLALVFLWINLVIENAFARTPRLALGDVQGHAHDLTTSLAWGLYAIVLLVLGTARHVSPLRWASLATFLLSIGKVFLRDLAHLDGLYRVASLAGLALSLIAVSLFYQRFVFRRVDAGASA